ncbi:hypothetical protein PSAB6_400003 [Paraburkholderia sabiae]|nr:hypothetical protein PSAB6_400003 [Paraburkholderia sabiae]
MDSITVPRQNIAIARSAAWKSPRITSPNKRQEEKAGRVAPVIVSFEMPKGVYLWLTL